MSEESLSYQVLVDCFGGDEAARIYVELYRLVCGQCYGHHPRVPDTRPNLQLHAASPERQEKIAALLREARNGTSQREQRVSYDELKLRFGCENAHQVYDEIERIIRQGAFVPRHSLKPLPDLSWANRAEYLTSEDIQRIEAVLA